MGVHGSWKGERPQAAAVTAAHRPCRRPGPLQRSALGHVNHAHQQSGHRAATHHPTSAPVLAPARITGRRAQERAVHTVLPCACVTDDRWSAAHAMPNAATRCNAVAGKLFDVHRLHRNRGQGTRRDPSCPVGGCTRTHTCILQRACAQACGTRPMLMPSVDGIPTYACLETARLSPMECPPQPPTATVEAEFNSCGLQKPGQVPKHNVVSITSLRVTRRQPPAGWHTGAAAARRISAARAGGGVAFDGRWPQARAPLLPTAATAPLLAATTAAGTLPLPSPPYLARKELWNSDRLCTTLPMSSSDGRKVVRK